MRHGHAGRIGASQGTKSTDCTANRSVTVASSIRTELPATQERRLRSMPPVASMLEKSGNPRLVAGSTAEETSVRGEISVAENPHPCPLPRAIGVLTGEGSRRGGSGKPRKKQCGKQIRCPQRIEGRMRIRAGGDRRTNATRSNYRTLIGPKRSAGSTDPPWILWHDACSSVRRLIALPEYGEKIGVASSGEF